MCDTYEVECWELAGRIAELDDVDAFGMQYGLSGLKDYFKVGQLFPPNAGQEPARNVLRALGYDFADDQSISIVVNGQSPLVGC